MIRIDFTDEEIAVLSFERYHYQRCALVQEKAKALGIELLFLPSYSPNLNLIERVWKFVKAESLGREHYENFQQFQQGINDCLSQLSSTHKEKMDTLITRNFPLFEKQTFLAAPGIAKCFIAHLQGC